MKKLLILSLTLISPFALVSELNVPNQFEDGQVTSAEQMNANFEAIQAAVNDNHARIESMQQPTKAVFQGFSTDSMNGGQGLIAMQQACHNFVPGSHICNITEFAESPYNPQALESMTDDAWILLNFANGGSQQSYATDKNGLKPTNNMSDHSCSGWNDTGTYGLYVSPTGEFEHWPCAEVKKIACCK
jgi:hypothetical protein